MHEARPNQRKSTTNPKPRSLPKLRRGEGSMWWDDERRVVVYEHRYAGRTYRERAATPAECFELRDMRRAELDAEAERIELEQTDNPTVAMLLIKWRGFEAKGAPRTLMTYDNSIKHITAHLGGRLVRELKVAHLEDMYSLLVTQGLGTAGLIKVRTHLAMALDFAVRREYVEANVARRSKLPETAQRPSKPVWLMRDGFAQCRQYLIERPTPYNVALLTCLLTGLRPGEVLGLRWVNVDLDAGTLTVATAVQAQGSRELKVTATLKTPHSRRQVQLPADLVRVLRRHRRVQRAVQMAAASWGELGLVFTSSSGQVLWPPNLDRACRVMCRKLDLPALSPNKLRHSFASACLDAGLSSPTVARALGHKDARMVEVVYGHSLDTVAPTAQALEQFTVEDALS